MKRVVLLVLALVAGCQRDQSAAQKAKVSDTSMENPTEWDEWEKQSDPRIRAKVVSEDDIKGWQPFDAQQVRYLWFDFPDGSRGVRGRVEGLAKFISGKREPIEEVVAKCAGRAVYLPPPPSHHYLVVLQSDRDDVEVVRCVQRSTSLHFSPAQSADPPSLAKLPRSAI